MDKKNIEITSVKLLEKSMTIEYSHLLENRLVNGSKCIKEAPTINMLNALKYFTDQYAKIFHWEEIGEDWLKENVVATGFKLKVSGKNGDEYSCTITGKVRLESNQWIGTSTDFVPFNGNAYGITDLDKYTTELQVLMKNFFFPDLPEQKTIEETE